jgi:hypothetical protein
MFDEIANGPLGGAETAGEENKSSTLSLDARRYRTAIYVSFGADTSRKPLISLFATQ